MVTSSLGVWSWLCDGIGRERAHLFLTYADQRDKGAHGSLLAFVFVILLNQF